VYNGKTKRGRNGKGENLYGTFGEVYKLYEIEQIYDELSFTYMLDFGLSCIRLIFGG
jgi:hypothetical protein